MEEREGVGGDLDGLSVVAVPPERGQEGLGGGGLHGGGGVQGETPPEGGGGVQGGVVEGASGGEGGQIGVYKLNKGHSYKNRHH